jgi:hypothetical protein
MQDKKLVDEMEEASTKLDIAIEAGGRGDWSRAEPCLAEVKRKLTTLLMAVERLNDMEKLSGQQ